MITLKSLTIAEKLLGAAFIAIIAVFAFLFVRDLMIGTKDVEAKLGANQAGAAIDSGKDAVDTVGKNQSAADDTDAKVKDAQDEVDKANDADSADAAGRSGLCEQFSIGCEE